MKKIILSSIAAAVLSVSLNATVFATVNGEDVVDADIQVLMRAMQGAKFEDLPADAKQKIVEQDEYGFRMTIPPNDPINLPVIPGLQGISQNVWPNR